MFVKGTKDGATSLSWCANSEDTCVNKFGGTVAWSVKDEIPEELKTLIGRDMEAEDQKHTPAALPIMIGMVVMLLLVVIYCVWAWVRHSK